MVTVTTSEDSLLAMSTSAPEPYHHGDLRAALLRAAEAMLAAQGPQDLSLRAVARAAGVSHNAPYRHFASREALLAELAAEGFRRLAAVLEGAGAGMAALGRAYLGFAGANPALYRLMFGQGPSRAAHPALAAAADAAFAPLAARRPNHAAALRAWALVHGIAQLRADGHWPEPGAALAEAVLREEG